MSVIHCFSNTTVTSTYEAFAFFSPSVSNFLFLLFVGANRFYEHYLPHFFSKFNCAKSSGGRSSIPATIVNNITLLKPTGHEMHQQFKLLKPTGHVMHQQFNIQQLYVLPTLYLCVLYLSENKQRLVPLTA